MNTYGKAVWHIDGGEKEKDVITRFKEVFSFLEEKNMLNDEGLETLEYGMDSSASLNSNMVVAEGEAFLDKYYDVVLGQNPIDIKKNLQAAYDKYVGEA